jgi:hypothetical protein
MAPPSSLARTSPAAAGPANDGLPAGVPVPRWALHHNGIRFLPTATSAASIANAGASSRAVGGNHPSGELGRRCEPAYCPVVPLFYKGGKVQHNPVVDVIFWGSSWNETAGSELRTQMMKLYGGLSGSAWQGVLTQYFDVVSEKIGYISPTVTANSITDVAPTPKEVTDANLQEEVARALSLEAKWTREPDAEFVVVPGPGATYKPDFVGGFCAYHSEDNSGSRSSYSFVPDINEEPFRGHCIGFDPRGNGSNVTSMVAAHEYAESATDPEPEKPGWQDVTGYENADICSSGDDEIKSGPLSGSWVQGTWDDHQSACSLADENPPHVLGLTQTASNVSKHEATLNATVNAEGLETSYHFEYGTTTSYGNSVPASNVSVGSGLGNQLVHQTISGLQLETTYHYRVVAANSSGTTYGEDHTFVPSQWSIGQLPLPSGTGRSRFHPSSFGTASASCRLPSPADGGDHSCGGVSCPSRASCLAVGTLSDTNNETGPPLAERWNGSQWSFESLPFSTLPYVGMTGVSCASTSACMAVGEGPTNPSIPPPGDLNPVADSWTSSTGWSITPVPLPTEAKEAGFEGVSCSSSTECVAVGISVNSAGHFQPYAALWQGGSWTVKTVPSPPEAVNTMLEGVSCPSATFCIAVGMSDTSSGRIPVSESWNGSSWSLGSERTSAKTPSEASGPKLFGVSCASPSACMAVGSYGAGSGSNSHLTSLTERWNGTEWSIQAPANAARNEELTGVSCASAETCTAVGAYASNQGVWVAMVQTWNGVAWGAQASNVDETQPSELHAVSCAFQSTCAAVGTIGWSHFGVSNSDPIEPLAEIRPDASMAVQETPTASHGVLAGASCAASTACIGVGSYKNSSETTVSLADEWNGLEWGSRLPVNPSGAKATELRGVSCTSPSECTAVGSYTNSSGAVVTLAERFNGVEWTPETPPNPSGASESRLSSVSCTSSSNCSAVGFYKNSSGTLLSLAERWIGSVWAIQKSQNPPGTNIQLIGVSCSATGACTAVGTYTNPGAKVLSLAERLSGSEWKIQSTEPPPGSKAVELRGVSCPSASACTAVGSYTNSSGNTVSLAEGWNGSIWTLQPMASPAGALNTRAAGVSCAASGVCAAVGSYEQSAGRPAPLAELWNGSEWLLWPATSPSGAEGGELLTVSCVSSYACEAAGSYTRSATQLPLAEGLGVPGAATGSAANVTKTSAKLTGSVQPNAWDPTTYHFEYGPTTAYGTRFPVPDAALQSESSAEVQQTIAFPPAPATTYHFRLVASNAAGTTFGKDQTFTSVAVPPPGVSTGPATNVTATNATLTATVTPNSWPTTYHFEYGQTTSYGTSVPVPDASLKSETTAEEVSRTIVVAPGTTYHFRLVARHTGEPPGEPVDGEDRTFTTPTAPAPSFTSSFGSLGTGGGQFNFPEGVAVDSKGNVWVADHKNNRVQEFSPAGEFMMTFGFGVKDGQEVEETCTSSESCQTGLPGSHEGQFRGVSGIAVEKASGNLWVADWENGRVEEFSSAGKYLTSVKTVFPTLGVAVDSSGNVWVTSAGSGVVQEFSSSPLHPELRQFRMGWASGVAADSQGNISVVNEGNNRVDEFSPEGNFIRTFGWGVQDGKAVLETCTSKCQAGIPGSGPGQMYLPGGVAIDEKGILWVSDVVNNRVEEFTPTGEYITQFGSGGGGPGFNTPWGPAVSGGSAYVTDRANNRVQKWTVTE